VHICGFGQEESMILTVNGVPRDVAADADKPLLWVIREDLGLTGTKFGCGVAACGACTVLVDGEPVRSCSFPASAASGAAITTIEGLASNGTLSAVQQAWLELQVPQCGYCQSGMIMAAEALLAVNANPTDADIDDAMTNICRCGTYDRVRTAVRSAAAKRREA
jgi:isoquinoline 1-oxidoreductase subunit alpha